MELVVIVNNYGKIYDGIGMYSYNVVEELKKLDIKVNVLTGNTKNGKRINSWQLFIKLIDYFIKNLLRNKRNIFLIEYPFYEWNPFTIFIILMYKIKFRKSIFVLSLHEYKRVNIFRKVIINLLLKITNYNIITINEGIKKFEGKTIMKRYIPSNIKNINTQTKKEVRDKKKYCYFGLINGSKAFKEMIEAWKQFNIKKEYTLEIYTATETKSLNISDETISVYYNLNNIEISQKIFKNEFMILPIKPYIDIKNGSLLAALEHEIIPIGIFHNSLPEIGIKIFSENYTKNNIFEALNKSKKLSEKIRYSLRKEGIKFLRNKTFKDIAKNMKEVLEKL